MPVYTASDFGTDVPTSANNILDFGPATLHSVNALLGLIAPQAALNGDGTTRRDFKSAAAEFTTTSLTPVSVTGTPLTLSVAATSFVLVMWQAQSLVEGASHTATTTPYMDGAATGGGAITQSNTYVTLNGILAVPIASAGSHTVELRLSTNNASNAAHIQNAFLAALAIDF